MPGGLEPTEEPYVDLYEHNVRLQELTRWDWSAPVLSASGLSLGAAVGALAAGAEIGSKGVLVCLVAGVILLVCGLMFKDERSKDMRSIYEEFDRRLCLYDDEPRAKAIRDRLDEQAKTQSAEHTLPAKLRRLKTRVLG
jgi:hypothetical protein